MALVGETGKGDSYLSDVIRVKFHGVKQSDSSPIEIQVVLKSIPKNVARRKTFRSHMFFENEIKFYQFVLPKLLEFQSEHAVPEPFDNYTPVFASYTDGDHDFIALEDVSKYEYGSPVRQEGIDYEHCKTVLKTFAKFHAMSFAMRDQKPEEFEKMSNNIFETYYSEKYRKWYTKFWKRLCVAAIDAVEKEYPGTKYVDKIKEFASEETYTRMIAAVENTKANGVISHGDSWTTNFLFKYPGGSTVPIDAKMFDFQLTRCASPALDVSFFVYACTTEAMRKDFFDKMLKFYHDTLTKQIKDLGSDPASIYPYQKFTEEFNKYAYFGLGFSMESTPFIVLEPEDAFDLDLMTGDEAIDVSEIWQIKPYKNLAGRRRAADNIVHAIDNGYL